MFSVAYRWQTPFRPFRPLIPLVEEKTRVRVRFLRRKQEEYEAIKAEIEELQAEVNTGSK